jgi:hypothetical protein
MPDKFLRFIHCLLQPNANYTKTPRLVVAASTATATLAATRCISIPAQLWAAFVTPPIGPQRLRRTSPALSPFILYFMALHTTMHGASSMQSSAAARPPNRDTTTNFP